MKVSNLQFTLKEKNNMVADIADIKLHVGILNGETGELRDLYKKIVEKLDRTDQKVEDGNLKTVQVQTDVSWLKQAYWVVATASVGALVMAVFNLLGK